MIVDRALQTRLSWRRQAAEPRRSNNALSVVKVVACQKRLRRFDIAVRSLTQFSNRTQLYVGPGHLIREKRDYTDKKRNEQVHPGILEATT
jgi:hypothetical protein